MTVKDFLLWVLSNPTSLNLPITTIVYDSRYGDYDKDNLIGIDLTSTNVELDFG